MKYIYSDNLTSFDNMMLDSYLFHKTTDDYLRVYKWKKPTISLGVKNDLSLLNLEYIKKRNIDLVYRETGGGVIFHNEDLCFTIIASKNIAPKENYNFVKKIFEQILFELNLNVTTTNSTNINSDICFLGSNQHEISVDNKKVIGIAQKIKNKRFLVQGSIQLKTISIKKLFNTKQDIVQFGLTNINFNLLKTKIYNLFDTIFQLEIIAVENILKSNIFNEFKEKECNRNVIEGIKWIKN